MLTININPNLGNQSVTLSDNSTGQLSGVRFPGTVQWTFISTGHKYEGFVFAGMLNEGQIIDSLNEINQYKIHFI